MSKYLFSNKIISRFLLFFILVACEVSDQENKTKDNITKQNITNQNITFWGDSMTAGVGGEGITISKVVSTQLNRNTFNFGVGGLSSESIAILQGGLPFIVKIDNNLMPSFGDVPITEYNILPFNNQTNQSRIGYLSDIKGELIRVNNTDNFIFRRSDSGDPINVGNSTPFLFEDAISHTKDIVVIWSGRNDPRTNSQIQNIKNNIQSMVDYLSNNQQFVIVSVCNGDSVNEGVGTAAHSNIVLLNNTLRSSFENNFLDLRKYMVEQAIYDSGIIPTQQDICDMNSDCIPTSLRSDGVHFNAKGYEMAGRYIAKFIEEKGW